MSSIRVAALAVAAAGAGALFARTTFFDQLDALDRDLADTQDAVPKARRDLLPEVAALAERLGASAGNPARYVEFQQVGTMWMKLGGPPQRFTARQQIGTSNSGFVWRARIGRFGQIVVVDSFVAGRGMLEARLFGVARVAKLTGTASIDQGELLRYLAELPLNPDSILFDHALEWTVADTHAIKVATGTGDARAEITFGLDDDGLIVTASAASRAYGTSGKRYPWAGCFWNYQRASGRLLPMQAAVAWDIDGAEFTYWRGTMHHWNAVADHVAE